MNNNGKTHERRNYVFKNEDEETIVCHVLLSELTDA